MSFLLKCLSTVGNWIAGEAVKVVQKFIIDGILVIGNFLATFFGTKLIIGLAIAVVTFCVITTIYETIRKIKEKNNEVKIPGLDSMKEKLNKKKGDAAHIKINCYTFKQKLKNSVNNLIQRNNIELIKEESMNIFLILIRYI